MGISISPVVLKQECYTNVLFKQVCLLCTTEQLTYYRSQILRLTFVFILFINGRRHSFISCSTRPSVATFERLRLCGRCLCSLYSYSSASLTHYCHLSYQFLYGSTSVNRQSHIDRPWSSGIYVVYSTKSITTKITYL